MKEGRFSNAAKLDIHQVIKGMNQIGKCCVCEKSLSDQEINYCNDCWDEIENEEPL